MSVAQQLGQLLVDRGVMGAEAVADLQERAGRDGTGFARLVVETGAATPNAVLETVAAHLDLEFFDRTTPIEPDAVASLDPATALAQIALPVRVDGGTLVVAVANPFDGAARTVLRRATGLEIRPALAHRAGLEQVVRKVYSPDAASPSPQAPAAAPAPVAPPSIANGEPGVVPDRHLNEYLEILLEHEGSDLHLTAGSPPRMRINGRLTEIDQTAVLKPEPLREMIYSVLTGRQREQFENDLELDCSHPLPGRGRFRMNVFMQRGAVGAVLRAIPAKVKSVEELGLPSVVKDFASLSRGLVLVTGATGSGKSTTLASVIDLINTTRAVHIVTIEDPIEFLHRHDRALVNQREIGGDTLGFASALRHALRQDPDVILVGEMRDLETIGTALTAAETGHLVFATLHTQDAPKSVERIIDVFPPHQQAQVRVQLAGALQGVISQQLLPTADGRTRVAAVEVMVATAAIRNLIREGKVFQIMNAMQAGGKHGMQTMDQSLASLVRRNVVDRSVAIDRAGDVQALLDLLAGRQQ